MKIVNPLYDKALKYLMQNERIARKVLSVLLDEEIIELDLGQQETHASDDKRGLSLFRLDFKARIRNAEGKEQTVLIELQKSKFATDIRRFRNYLGMNYMNTVAEAEKLYNKIRPIITVYILGYNLDDVPYMAVTVNRQIVNSVSKEPVAVDSFFINHLTHRSHILQVRRLPAERKSRLEQFMMFFNQSWISGQNYILDLQEIPEGFHDVAQYLQKPLLDDAFRRQLDAEEEIDFIFDQQESRFEKKIEEARMEADTAKQAASNARMEADTARQDALQTKTKLAKLLHEMGKSVEEISNETGLSIPELNNLMNKPEDENS